MDFDDETLKLVGVLAVVAIVLAGLGLVASGRLQVGAVTVDTDTIGYEDCGLASFGLRGHGHFPDGADTARKRGEIFTVKRVWYSWFEDGQSFPVTGEGVLKRCGLEPVTWPTKIRWIFDINTGAGFTRFRQDAIPTGILDMEFVSPGPGTTEQRTGAFTFQIDGFSYCAAKIPDTGDCPAGNEMDIVDGSSLRVRMYVWCEGLFMCAPADPNPHSVLLAQDEVELRSALPRRLDWQTGACKVGSTCVLNWEIPVDKDENGNPAYFLTIRDMNENLPIAGYDRKPLSGTSGQERVAISGAMFSKNLETCQNRLRAQIYSQLIPVGLDEVAIQSTKEVSGVATPPQITSVTFDKRDYKEGDTVTVRWTASGNITKFHVVIAVNGAILFDRDLAADVREASVVTPTAGFGDVEITPYTFCQPGDVREEHFVVGNFFGGLCTLFPEIPQCAGENALAWVFLAAAVLAVLAAFMLVLWAIEKTEADVPAGLRLLLAFLAAAGVAFLALGAGAFDVVLGVV